MQKVSAILLVLNGWFKGLVMDKDLLSYNLPRLAAAVLIQAFIDARAGDREALTFLLQDAPIWMDSLGMGEITPERIMAKVKQNKIPALVRFQIQLSKSIAEV